MEIDVLKVLGEMGGVLACVAGFLWYLGKRDADLRSLTDDVVKVIAENSKALAHLDDSVGELKDLFRIQSMNHRQDP